MNKRLVGLLAGLVFALSVVANVQALPITLNNGESTLLNFDLTGGTPAPPFASVVFAHDSSPFTFSPDLFVRYFDELNGAGNIVFANRGSGSSPTRTETFIGAINAGVLDGLFSALITVNAGGPITISNVVATGFSDTGSSFGPIAGVPVPAAVPELSTLALLGIGLVGVGFARRRQNRAECTA